MNAALVGRTGTMRFGRLVIRAGPELLTPRPWTLLQSDWAAELATTRPAGPVMELCTGAGHIGLEVARRTGRSAILVDRDPAACRAAAANAVRNGLAGRVEVRCRDLRFALDPDDRPAVLLADPPYLTSADVARYPGDPRHAVDGGADGLALLRAALNATAPVTRTGTPLLLQVRGLAQAAAVERWLGTRPAPRLAVAEVRSVDAERAVALIGPADPREP